MAVLLLIIGTTFLISLIAFIGALTLFLKEKLLNKVLLALVAFSAGSLLGGAFLHLLPEAIAKLGMEEDAVLKVFLYLILGFCVFFVLEHFIRWHHHHSMAHPAIMPFSYMVLVSDGVHNFIDGLIIAASFVVSVPLGLVTALAVALHEIPQEMGDFGILVYGGFKKVRALFLNFASAITVILGGIVGFLIAGQLGKSIIFLLPFAAGNFIYIACSDLIPELKYKVSAKKSFSHFLVFLVGLGLMLVLKLVFD